MCGIVQQGGDDVTTYLHVAFSFKTQYLTKDGTPTHIIIACGTQVTINLVLGILFLKTNHGVIECKALDCTPFPMEYKRTCLSVSNKSSREQMSIMWITRNSLLNLPDWMSTIRKHCTPHQPSKPVKM